MTARACVGCADQPATGCCSDFVDAAVTSSHAHRCMEQLCFAVGSCLLEPCLSLRPKPDVAGLAAARIDCAAVELLPSSADPALVCAFADVAGGRDLFYGAYAPKSNIRNCWEALELMGEEKYQQLRVWEQLGWSATPQRAIAEYDRYAHALLFEARAGGLL